MKTDVLDTNLESISSVFDFHEPFIERMLHALKYEFIDEAWDCLSKMLQKSIDVSVFSGIDVLIPIPLHKRRFAERGFNQSMKIAQIISHLTQIPIAEPLQRVKYTKQQARLHRLDRLKNVDSAFEVIPSHTMYTSAMIIDDVYTTGSTMQACATILRDFEVCRRVYGFSLARG